MAPGIRTPPGACSIAEPFSSFISSACRRSRDSISSQPEGQQSQTAKQPTRSLTSPAQLRLTRETCGLSRRQAIAAALSRSSSARLTVPRGREEEVRGTAASCHRLQPGRVPRLAGLPAPIVATLARGCGARGTGTRQGAGTPRRAGYCPVRPGGVQVPRAPSSRWMTSNDSARASCTSPGLPSSLPPISWAR